MALNPPILPDGEPQLLPNEDFKVNKKVQGEFIIQTTQKVYKAKGKCKLSQLRIIFINDDEDDFEFRSFELPLINILKFQFNKLIIRNNYLTGLCTPKGNDLPSYIEFELRFKYFEGSKFVKTLKELHQNRNLIVNQQAEQPQIQPIQGPSDADSSNIAIVVQPNQHEQAEIQQAPPGSMIMHPISNPPQGQIQDEPSELSTMLAVPGREANSIRFPNRNGNEESEPRTMSTASIVSQVAASDVRSNIFTASLSSTSSVQGATSASSQQAPPGANNAQPPQAPAANMNPPQGWERGQSLFDL